MVDNSSKKMVVCLKNGLDYLKEAGPCGGGRDLSCVNKSLQTLPSHPNSNVGIDKPDTMPVNQSSQVIFESNGTVETMKDK